MNILIFSASPRTESLNTKLCKCVEKFLSSKNSLNLKFKTIQEYNIPILDPESEKEVPGVTALMQDIQNCNALIVSTPEYNGSISSIFKNTLDWLSIQEINVLKNKQVLLMAASPGGFGGVRGLWHTKVTLDVLGSFVYPELFALSKAHENLEVDFVIKVPALQKQLESLLSKFIEHVK